MPPGHIDWEAFFIKASNPGFYLVLCCRESTVKKLDQDQAAVRDKTFCVIAIPPLFFLKLMFAIINSSSFHVIQKNMKKRRILLNLKTI